MTTNKNPSGLSRRTILTQTVVASGALLLGRTAVGTAVAQPTTVDVSSSACETLRLENTGGRPVAIEYTSDSHTGSAQLGELEVLTVEELPAGTYTISAKQATDGGQRERGHSSAPGLTIPVSPSTVDVAECSSPDVTRTTHCELRDNINPTTGECMTFLWQVFQIRFAVEPETNVRRHEELVDATTNEVLRRGGVPHNVSADGFVHSSGEWNLTWYSNNQEQAPVVMNIEFTDGDTGESLVRVDAVEDCYDQSKRYYGELPTPCE